MKLCNLCSGVYPSLDRSKIKSHDCFITKLFVATGDNLYISTAYKKKLFSGDKPFANNLKVSLRGKDNQASLTSFFMDCIDDNKVSDVLAFFSVPEKEHPNKKALSVALALQMKAIVDCNEENAENIIITSYLQAKTLPAEQEFTTTLFKPLYDGDDVYVEGNAKYEIYSHDKVPHTWSITNAGKIMWSGRKLVYQRGPNDRPEANPYQIDIPDTSPGENIKITTIFDGRGFDGVYRCKWEMQDSDGVNCFPKRDSLFCVTIDSKFKRK
ncbi:MAG: hypothetical protein LUH03_10700 [Oscillospiraceae bacterium]|nr:hypothetical protein [Oscillospiraceae bacterium]